MIRQYTKTLLLSARLLNKQFAMTPLNMFTTFKPAKPLNRPFLLNNNSFTFAELPKHKVLTMPALSPTMTEGKIVKWNVKEGDEINEGDIICEVETDKATMGFESTDKGFVAKIYKPEGMVELGTPLLVVTKKPADVSSFSGYTFGKSQSQSQSIPASQAPKQQQPAVTKPNTPSVSYPKHGIMKLPAVSPTMTEGKIIEWKVKVGDSFEVGDSIFSIETDKATMDYQATEKGVLAKIINDGLTKPLPVGELVAVFTKKKEDVEKFKDYQVGQSAVVSAPAVDATKVQQTQTQQQTTSSASSQSTNSSSQSTNSSSGDRIIASPLAKTLAQQKGINLSQIRGSGPDGRIIKQDVESYTPKQVQKATETVTVTQAVKQQKPVASTAPQTKRPKKVQILQNPYEQIPLNGMRKTIANRLTESKTTIPHYYVQVSVQMGKVIELRQQLNKNEQGIKISVNDIIVKAVALALRDIPDVNSQWHGTLIKKFKHSDVSVAVATEGGLITPIVFRAEQLGLLDIARKTKDLAKRARQGKLDPSQFIGGTTTVSNLGMFGISSVTSVINPPQSTILGVGATQKKVVFDASSTDPKAPYKVIDSMQLIVSADHRVVDGALSAKWLGRIKKYLEDPVSMLL